MAAEDKHQRRIRSFVMRHGRLTNAQKKALDEFWPAFGIETEGSALDYQQLFGNDQPVTLEIGYGMGGSLAEMAKADPERNFIGIEVHPPGIGNLLRLIHEQEISNLRLIAEDAVEILKNHIAERSLERVHLYFPDPWPKKKHHKRRIVQADFARLIASRLLEGGIFHMATDWEDYAIHMAEVMQAADEFVSTADTPYAPRPDFRPLTKFENRGLKLGHGVWDLIYRKQ